MSISFIIIIECFVSIGLLEWPFLPFLWGILPVICFKDFALKGQDTPRRLLMNVGVAAFFLCNKIERKIIIRNNHHPIYRTKER